MCLCVSVLEQVRFIASTTLQPLLCQTHFIKALITGRKYQLYNPCSPRINRELDVDKEIAVLWCQRQRRKKRNQQETVELKLYESRVMKKHEMQRQKKSLFFFLFFSPLSLTFICHLMSIVRSCKVLGQI